MKISTKGRYAVRVMIDLAENNSGDFVTLMDIAKRQDISEKYLEAIVSILSKKGLLLSLRGKGGGYKLAKEPNSYSIGNILRLTEGSLAPVACLENDKNSCERHGNCKTISMWKGLDTLINDYLDGITVADLAKNPEYIDNYII